MQQHPRPMISAHRGGRREAPENTVAAFARAVELGVPAAECDVHLSGDGVAVVIHDDTVDRTTDGQGAVHTFTVEDLAALDARGDLPDWPDPVGVPTFAEVLEVCRELAYFEVEIKADDPERIEQLIPSLVVDIENAECEEIIRFISFDADIIARCHELAPDIPTSLVGMFALPLDLQPALDLQCAGISGAVQLLNRQVVEAAHEAGLSVTCWTVNTVAEWERLVGWGVDVVTTDVPSLLLAEHRG